HDVERHALPFIDQFDTVDSVRDVLEAKGILGPFPLNHSDVVNTIASIHFVQGRRELAVQMLGDALIALEGKPHKYRYAIKSLKKKMEELMSEAANHPNE
ncbi:MAG: hypothetical protein H7X80_06215, partial [bacterium]|nr:hypothetical protein [Candidatus Kapabacteria bacterium]